jgi:D-alanyl-lipoteichoic acid acyltransferase DltB (MBOAT superfamily)
MLFNSVEFAIFLPIVLAVYYLLPHRGQNRFLLLASCLFYAAWDWRFLFPLLFSTIIDYYSASRMETLIIAGAPKSALKKYLILSVVTNLGLLGFFKYFNFFNTSFANLLGAFGWRANPIMLDIILPVGISFYTFQALSYTIDVYRGQLHSTKHFADFLLAVLYFPHLVAGPIQRAHNLIAQVVNPRVITREKIAAGLHLMFWGFFKKVFISDNLGPIVNRVFASSTPTGFDTVIGVVAFAVQIYCDFSGYTDIARGVAKLMGFEFMLNFNLPYFATNPSDFWQRWHISLSSWLRDYLYIPLGGNRGSAARVYRNLMLTMVIGGLWHGAAWNFVLWGFYHGSLLILHRVFLPILDRIFATNTRAGEFVSRLIRIVCMFALTCYGWLLFRAISLEQIWNMTVSLLRPLQGFDEQLALRVLLISLPLLVVQTIQYVSKRLEFLAFPWLPAAARVSCYAVFTYFVLFRGGKPQAFIYFQF